MRRLSVCLLMFLVQGALAQHIDEHGRPIFNVESFGAVGDGGSDNTVALLNAWRVACNKQSAILSVPSNGTFLLRPVTFQGPCRGHLTLRLDGILVAPNETQSWGIVDSWLTFTDLNHFTIWGRGNIHGRGQPWWEASCSYVNNKRTCTDLPTSIRFEDSRRIKVKGLTFVDSPHFHLHFLHCNHVAAVSLRITAPTDSPRTDGIHIEHTINARILNTTIQTGDDCISVGNGSVNVTISELICGPGHGISIGSLGKWSSEAQVYNIVVSGAKLTGTKNGLQIKTWQGGHGWARHIVFKHIEMIDVSNPVVVDQYYRDSPLPCENKTSAVEISDVTFRDIVGTSRTDTAVRLACSKHIPCKHIFLNDISLKATKGGATLSSYCQNAEGQAEGEINPPSCLS